MYYLSVFGYALKALALNEFSAAVYNTFIPLDAAQVALLNPTSPAQVQAACADGTLTCQREGDFLLSELNLTTNMEWEVREG